MKRSLLAIAAVALLTSTVQSGASAADTTTVKITGNTVDVAAGENGSKGWWFNRDDRNDTPYEFTSAEQRIGAGSLYVAPIGANAADKFVGEHFVGLPIAELESISFDFLAGPGTEASNFYLNVYAVAENDSKYYDCRYDFVATPDAGGADGWRTLSTATTAARVTKSSSSRVAACPAELTDFDSGFVRMYSINVGQTSTSDVGDSGYLDNVVQATTSGTTVYDFDVPAAAKDDCRNGGYALYGFDNQGQCIKSLQANDKAGN